MLSAQKKTLLFIFCLLLLFFLSGVLIKLKANKKEQLFSDFNRLLSEKKWFECHNILMQILDSEPSNQESLSNLYEIEQIIHNQSMPATQKPQAESNLHERLNHHELNDKFPDYNHFEAVLSILSSEYLLQTTAIGEREIIYNNFFAGKNNNIAKIKFNSPEEIYDFIENTLLVKKLYNSDLLTINELNQIKWQNAYIRRELLFNSKISGAFTVWVYEPENITQSNGKTLLKLKAFAELNSFTPQTAGLLTALAESAIREKALGKTSLSELLDIIGQFQDLYLHDLILMRLSDFCLYENEYQIRKFIPKMKGPLASLYNAIIISRIAEKQNTHEILKIRELLNTDNSLVFENGLRIWFCQTYENRHITQKEFLKQTNGKSYNTFCNQELKI